MADTICCLLCRGVVLYTEKDQSRYKTHLTIEHKVFYHIPWLIIKTIEETGSRPLVNNDEVPNSTLIGTQVDKTLLLGSSVSISPLAPAQGDSRLMLGSSVSIIPVPVKPPGAESAGQFGSVSVSLTNVSTGKVVSMNNVGIKEEINHVLNTINSEELLEDNSPPKVNEESLEEDVNDEGQGIQFNPKKPRRDKTYQCKVCHKYYSERRGLKRHMRRKHVGGVTDENDGENDVEGETEVGESDAQGQEDMEFESQEEMEGYDSENAIVDPLQSEVRDLVRNIISGEDVGDNGSDDALEEEVIQRRGDYGEPRINFTRPWADYKHGFGDLYGEFWFGNDYISKLSTEQSMMLRIELEAHNGTTAIAEYTTFRVDGESVDYRLWVGGYSGNATDSLSNHNGYKFSTVDRNNDEAPQCCPCAPAYGGGWWFYSCFEANLNGEYFSDPLDNGYYRGIIWELWLGDYSLKAAKMMIRPRDWNGVIPVPPDP